MECMCPYSPYRELVTHPTAVTKEQRTVPDVFQNIEKMPTFRRNRIQLEWQNLTMLETSHTRNYFIFIFTNHQQSIKHNEDGLKATNTQGHEGLVIS